MTLGPKGIRSILQKGTTIDYDLVIQYSPSNLLLHLLVVALICILAFAFVFVGHLDM